MKVPVTANISIDNWVVLGENNGDFVQSRGYNSAV
jgi:hypothetical protein